MDDQEEKLEAAYKAAQALDAAYAESDLFHHNKRMEYYASEIARLAEQLRFNRPKNADEAIDWSAEVMYYARCICSEWTGNNASKAWEMSADLYDND